MAEINKNVSLVKAVTDHDPAAVSSLLATGASVRYLDDLALRSACWLGYTDIVRLLIKEKANVHAGNEEPLFAAVRTRDDTLIGLLRENGARLDELLKRRKSGLDEDDTAFIEKILANDVRVAFEQKSKRLQKKAQQQGPRPTL